MYRWQQPGGRRSFGAGMGMGPAVKGLLIANVAVFVLQFMLLMHMPELKVMLELPWPLLDQELLTR